MPSTLRDVARHVGVSIKTVSNVVRGTGYMSEKTRVRVRAALIELDYQPNLPARYLRHAHVDVITLAIPDLSSYFAEIGEAVIAAASAASYTVLIDHTNREREKEAQVINGLRPHLIDGVILNPMVLEMEDLGSNRAAIPIVLLGERLFGAPYDHVVMDNVEAARQATHHLIAGGRRRIAVIGVKAEDDKADSTSRLRLEGYTQALAEAGYQFDPSLVAPADRYRRDEGAAAMRDLLALPAPPDAVFCFNDLLALGAMRTLREAGRRIPEDMAVCGFDDIEEARYAHPALTSIAPDKTRIATTAVEFLLGRVRGTRTAPPERVIVPFQLRVRESSTGHP